LTALANRGEVMNDYTLAVSRKFAQDIKVEAFLNSDAAADGSYKNNYFGLTVSRAFGAGGRKGNGLPDERSYRSTRSQDDLYAERDYQDHNLSQPAFDSHVGSSLRTVNEWSGSNLTYADGTSDEYARDPSQTYDSRSGKCDEQAWLVANTLNSNASFVANGGSAHILDYWTGTAGHGVALVDEGGKVFVNEYGRNFRVNVSPNASLQAQAQAAIAQLGPYLALKPQNNAQVSYGVWGTNAPPPTPGTYYMGYMNDANTQVPFSSINSYQAQSTGKVPYETGLGALIGLDGF
jgi:hypothetical protein